MLMHVEKHDLHKACDDITSAVVEKIAKEVADNLGIEITTQTEDTAADELDTVTDAEIHRAQRTYAHTHKDAIRLAQRKYYHTHREKCRSYQKAWRAAHPDRCKEYARRSWAKRALKLRQQSPPITTDDQLRQLVSDKREQLKNSDNAEDWQ